VYVTLSNPRLMKGHLLVIPKRHVEKISELSDEERSALLDLVIKFQELIIAKLAPGCDIRQNYRPFQKQGRIKVTHLHIHLLPRNLKDELYEGCQKYETEIFTVLSTKEESEIANLLA